MLENFSIGIRIKIKTTLKLILSLILWVSGCTHTSKVTPSTNSTVTNKKEDFSSFYQKFKSDSNFQINRVLFPLNGEFINNDDAGYDEKGNPTPTKKTLTKKEWVMIYSFDDMDTSEYKQSDSYSDSMVVKKIIGKGTGFRFEETYKLIKNQWYLIYIVDIDM